MYYDRQSLMISTIAATAFIGFCFGIGTGLLLAPHFGARTRRRLKHFTEDMIDDTKEAIEEFIDRGKQLMAVRYIRNPFKLALLRIGARLFQGRVRPFDDLFQGNLNPQMTRPRRTASNPRQ